MSSVSGRKFGRHRIYPKLGLLLRDERRVELNPRAFELLTVLVEAAGRLIGKNELIDRVWGSSAVEENNLQAQISAIRKALGPDRDLVSTEFGRGYRLLARIDDAEPHTLFSSGTASATAVCTLPVPVTNLIGRAAEIAELLPYLAQARLVTVVGPGGVGKTRLVTEIGRSLLTSFPSGVFLAELGKISEEQLVWPTIAAALQIPPSAPLGSVHLREFMAERRALLVVDNCEHLADAVAEIVTELLQTCAGLRVLGTSQEPLGAQGEQVYRLAPLAAPPRDLIMASTATAYSAVQLFVERTTAMMRDFRISEENVHDVCEICRRLDGIPLALELAAARVSALGLNGVLTGLDNRFKLLTAGRRTALARHRTLQSTVDWSFNLLRGEEQDLFRRLAVFPSEFTTEGAHCVAAPNQESWQVVDALGELAAKSLLSVDVQSPVARYRMLETIRFYALEKLAASNEVNAVVERHASFTAASAENAEIDWRTMPTEEWLRTHSAGLDDVRAALDWAFSKTGNVQTGIRILAHSVPFWVQYSQHHEGQLRLSKALQGSSTGDPITPREERAVQAALGTSLNWAKGPVQSTKRAWHRALELAVQLYDDEGELQSHYGLWLYNLRCGEYLDSLEHATAMSARSKKLSDGEAFAVSQRIMGVSNHFLGSHAEAHGLIEAALAWYDRNRPKRPFRFGLDQQVAGLAFLSRIQWVRGYTDSAIRSAADAIEKARAINHACTLCCALAEGWCMVHALNGDRSAVEIAAPTLIREATAHGLGFWKAYGELFLAWAKTGSNTAGLEDAQDPLAAVSDMEFDPLYSNLITDLLLQAGPDSVALSPFMAATERAAASRGDGYWSAPEFIRVRSHLVQRDALQQERELNRAYKLALKQGAQAFALRSGLDLAKMLADDLRPHEGIRALEPLLRTFPERRLSRDWQAAQLWCDEAAKTLP